jgi:hypothetical protein
MKIINEIEQKIEKKTGRRIKMLRMLHMEAICKFILNLEVFSSRKE